MSFQLNQLRSPSCIKFEKDKIYAWCILALSFLSHSLHLGFSFAVLGNLTIAHNSMFNYTSNEASYIGSVHSGLFFLLAPLASVMVKKAGCQVTEIMGGSFLILGLALSSLTSAPWHAYLFFGVFCAWGVSCCYIATSEILAQHFDKFKYLSFALAVFGYYVGMVVWPIVSQTLLDLYGYHKAMGIMSAFHVVHIIAGILFFSPMELNTDNSRQNEKPDVAGDIKLESELDKSNESYQAMSSQDNIIQTTAGKDPTILQSFVILLKIPSVWALLFNCMLWNFTTTSFLILVAFLSHLGLAFQYTGTDWHRWSNPNPTASARGVLNLVGTAMVMGLSRVQYDRLIMHVSASTLYCTMVVIMAFTSTKAMFYVLAAVWGLGQGALISNLLGVVYDFCGADQLSILFGLILLFEGVGGLTGVPLCEYIGKTYGGRYSLIVSGLAGILGTLVILPVLFIRCRRNRMA